MFKDKIAIVTGGASGIGRALGEELARRGAVVTLADRNAGLLEETVGAIKSSGGKVSGRVLNVADHNEVKKMVDDTVKEHGRIDYLFNNAGIGVAAQAHDYSYEDWKNVIDVNLYGVVNGVSVAYPIMVKQGFGHIINTASLAGLTPIPLEASYAASKYAIVGLSNVLCEEGAELGVKVSVVCPGIIDTPILKTSKTINMDRDKFLGLLPRMMPPEKCAAVILRGVERNKPVIIVTFLAKLAYVFQRISPGLVIRLWKWQLRKLRKDVL